MSSGGRSSRKGQSVHMYNPRSEMTSPVTLRSVTSPMRDTWPRIGAPGGRGSVRNRFASDGQPLSTARSRVTAIQATTRKTTNQSGLSSVPCILPLLVSPPVDEPADLLLQPLAFLRGERPGLMPVKDVPPVGL